MRRRSIELIILAPVLIFLILAGTSLYFMILTSVEDFADRNIRENLSSLSRALYSIADREIDELNKKGLAGDEKQTKIHQLSVLIEIEDFARQNEINIIVYDIDQNKIIFETGISEDADKIAAQVGRQRDLKIEIPARGTYYSRTVEFKPWSWRIVLVKDASAYSSLVKKVRYFYIATGAILLLIAIFLIVYLRRVIGRPINQIVTRLREGKPPEYKGIRELEFLSDSFDQIMGSLQAKTRQLEITLENMKRAEQELAEHRDHLEELVAERTIELLQANQHLEEAKLKAEAATQVKSRFLAVMSHELRKPLNSIIGFTRIVKRRSKDILPAKQYGNLEKVLVSSNDLLTLIDDILDLTKLEYDLMPIHPVDFVLEPLIDECLQTFEPMIKGKPVRLVKEFETDQSQLHTDNSRVKQILINLLDNAIKFTEEGTIAVTVCSRDGEITIAVTDTGIGIPEEKQDLLFQDFQQLDDSSTRQHGGTGLGLSISRRLARLMGGDITVDSTKGVGSTFTVTLPVRYTAAQSAERTTEISARST